jgi:hypothetical protein
MTGSKPADKDDETQSLKTESNLGEDEEQPAKEIKFNNINTLQQTVHTTNSKDSILPQQKVKTKKIKKKETKEEANKKIKSHRSLRIRNDTAKISSLKITKLQTPSRLSAWFLSSLSFLFKFSCNGFSPKVKRR